MNDTRQRLVKCFQAVFPELDERQVEIATPTTVETWDSVASITLLSVLEEEFMTTIDFEDLERLTSFQAVHDYIANEKQAA